MFYQRQLCKLRESTLRIKGNNSALPNSCTPVTYKVTIISPEN